MSQRHQRNRSLGPVLKISFPKFGFDEALREEKRLESYFEQQQQLLNRQQETQADGENMTKTRMFSASIREDESLRDQRRQQEQDHGMNASKRFDNSFFGTRGEESMRSGQRLLPKLIKRGESAGMKGNNTIVRQNSSEHNSSRIQSQKSKQEQSQSNQLFISEIRQPEMKESPTQLKDNSNLEWIAALKRKEQARAKRMPGRNTQRVSAAMQQRTKLIPNIYQVESFIIEEPQNQQLQQQNSTMNNNSGLNATSNLNQSRLLTSQSIKGNRTTILDKKKPTPVVRQENKNVYDKWDSEKTPDEWLKFYRKEEGPHGVCSVMVNNRQQMAKMQIVGYDKDSQKYEVKLTETGERLQVIRLQIIFNDEEFGQINEKRKPSRTSSALEMNDDEEDEDKGGKKLYPWQITKTKESLKKYDCWDQDFPPEHWIEFYKNKKGSHAMCPTYMDFKYQMTPVQVLEYNKEAEKFLVQEVKTGRQKWVIRLSLLFKDEDPQKHQERVELAQSRMLTAEDEERFLSFIDKMYLDSKSKIIPEWKNSIINKVLRRNPDQQKDSSEMDIGKQLKDLLAELDIDYIRQIKKGIIVRDMELNINTTGWQDNRIKSRYVPYQIPEIGTVMQIDYTASITRMGRSGGWETQEVPMSFEDLKYSFY